MATVSSLGVGSGMDLNGLLTKLMSVEQQPLIELTTREASANAKISALGSLSGALSSLQGAVTPMIPASGKTATEHFASFKATLADTAIATATAATGAVAGSYSIEVTQLAKAQRLTTTPGAYASSASPVLDSGKTTGSIRLEIGEVTGGAFVPKAGTTPSVINIDSSNNTLAGLRDAINAANAGVTATIITGNSGGTSKPQLVLTSQATGTANVIRLQNVDGLSALQYDPVTSTGGFSTAEANGGQAAQNAIAKINGIAVNSSTNSVSGAIDGVTLDLKKENAGSPTTLTVTTDSTIKGALNAFVKTFNDTAKTLAELGKYDSSGKNNGPLLGNATLRSVQSQLRTLVSSPPEGISPSATYSQLARIGVSFERDGTLKLDSSKLQTALDKDAAAVSDLVAKLATKINKALDSKAGMPSIVAAATDGLNRTIKDYGKMRETLATRLDQIQARYVKQFSSLDSLVASMNKTSSYLQQQLASLPGVSS